MAARTLANLGLKAFFAYGEDGWNDEVDTNFLMLSVLVQAGAINIVSVHPTSPAEGDVYVISSNSSSNPNTIAVFDAGAWQHFVPKNGWSIYNRATDAYLQWNGTAWMSLSLANLRALGALDASAGVLTQTALNTFSKTPLGVSTSASVLTRADGDLRYSNIAHTHPASGVTSFNTRTGDVALTPNDVNTALGFDANAASNLTSFTALSAASVGIIEKTGAGSFTARPVGTTGPTSLTTLAQADARYMPLSPYLVGLVNSTHTTNGLLEQTGTNQFAIRAIGGTNNGDILTRSIGDGLYVSKDTVVTQEYRVGWFFTSSPSASEVILIHTFTDTNTMSANFAGAVGFCDGALPTSTYVLDVQKNNVSVGSISISTSGVCTYTSSASVTFAQGDRLMIVAPSTPQSITNTSGTFKGAY